jgi:hypothetical protein
MADGNLFLPETNYGALLMLSTVAESTGGTISSKLQTWLAMPAFILARDAGSGESGKNCSA